MRSRWQNHVPTYRRYAPKDLAVVRLNGKDIYLGPYGSPESREHYDRLIAEWLAQGRQLPATASNGQAPSLSVNEILLRYLRHAAAYYARDGKPGREYVDMTYAIRPVKDLYGMTPAASFGPMALKGVREHLMRQDLCRREINKRVNRIRRVFKWAASEELIPISVFEALRTVDGLRFGRCPARETEPVRPVDLQHVDAVLPYVAPQVRAMIELQKLTGMRPGEVIRMRLCEIDRSEKTWQYRPADHKTKYRGFERQVPLGPRRRRCSARFSNEHQNRFFFHRAKRRNGGSCNDM
jgi:integrase